MTSSSSGEPYWPGGFLADLNDLASSGTEELDPSRLGKMYERAACEIVDHLIEDPARALADDRGWRAGFEARLVARWGKALDEMELTINHCVDCGGEINTVLRPHAAAQQDHKFEALIRLHGRAVMTAQEVLVLLRSGFSTGALSRWRTLHEVWVVFSLLSREDAELSRRYLAHDAIETMKAEKEYEETWEALGHDEPDSRASERTALLAQLENDFGPAFRHDYGWAAPLFNDKAPKLKDLTEVADLAHWRGYYRMASHGTHANPRGIRWNIQGMGHSAEEFIWAGPSNAGLTDPAQCTLIALCNVTVGLLAFYTRALDEYDDDEATFHSIQALLRQQTVLKLMDGVIGTFARIDALQQDQENSIATLQERALKALSDRAGRTLATLAEELDEDVDALSEALEAAVGRGFLTAERTYRTVLDTDEESQAER